MTKTNLTLIFSNADSQIVVKKLFFTCKLRLLIQTIGTFEFLSQLPLDDLRERDKYWTPQ